MAGSGDPAAGPPGPPDFCDGSSAERGGGKLPSLRLHVQMAGQGRPPSRRNGLDERRGRPLRPQVGVTTPVNARLAEMVEDVAAHPDRRAWLRHDPRRFLAELAGLASPGSADRASFPASIRRPILPAMQTIDLVRVAVALVAATFWAASPSGSSFRA